MNRYYETLELHKILEQLGDLTCNEDARAMAQSIEPMTDLYEVERSLKKTAQAFDLSVRFGTPSFRKIDNVCSALQRAKSGGKLSLRELLQVEKLLSQIASLSDWYSHCEQEETELTYFFTLLTPNPNLQIRIQQAIGEDESILDSASSTLASIRRKIVQRGMQVRETLDKMIKSSTMQTYLQEAIVTLRDGRFVIPVKSEHRGAVQGLIHDTSSSGQTYFIEPVSVVEANNDIRLLQIEEQAEIERILEALCADCGSFADSMIEDYHTILELNLYFSKANLGAKMKATVPNMTADGVIRMKKARHPLLDAKTCVPVDLELGDPYQALIITGPNTGGKTVALKTMGLLTAMAMCGLMIPVADGSQISVFKHILVNIGDQQSIEYNLSTFSAHTNEIIHILEIADDESLVLLDELGSGTDPVEGASLAVSIIEALKQRGAKIMTTTHYQELKLYAIENDEIQNACCEFDVNTLKPTYRLILGAVGKSNAFAISRSLGMPEEIIREAEQLVNPENRRFEQVVEQLEAQRIELEREATELKKLRREAEEQKAELERLRKEAETNRSEALEQARLQANRILERTKAESNQLIDELLELRKEKEKASFSSDVSALKAKSKHALDKMQDMANPVEQKKNDHYVLPRALKIGDTVQVVSLGQKGTIVSEPDRDMAFVQMGVMKTRVKLSDLQLIETAPTAQPKRKHSQAQVKRAGNRPQMECDIRGMTADEGVYQMESFLGQAVLAHLNTVTIIHGKGTGILRKAVHQKLKSLKVVKSYRLGVYGEGEDGVTIVELK